MSDDFTKQMQSLAAALDGILNGKASGADRKIGFVLLTFPFGQQPTATTVNYIGNGERADVYAALKELLARWDNRLDESRSIQ